MRCDQCDSLYINGIFCHETGCPNEWKLPRECQECGQVFIPESRWQKIDPDCYETLYA